MTGLPPRLLPNLRRALRLVWRSGPGWATASALLMLAQGVLPLLSLYLMKRLIDAVAAGSFSSEKPGSLSHVALALGLAGLVALGIAACDALAAIVHEEQAQTTVDHLLSLIHQKSIEVELQYCEDPHYHDTLHRAQQEGAFRPARIVKSLLQAGQCGVCFLGLASLLVTYHWGMAALLLIAAAPGVLLRLYAARERHQCQRRCTPIEQQARYYSWLLTLPSFAKEIRLFGLGPLFIQRFDALRGQVRCQKRAITTRSSLLEMAATPLVVLPLFGAFTFLAIQTVLGALTLGGLVMYYQACQRAQNALQSLLSNLSNLYEDHLFLTNLYEFLDLEVSATRPETGGAPDSATGEGIRFRGVSFSYPRSNRKALDEISLTIRAGEVIALVGGNGSGKSTLIKLLCGLYQPTRGTITLDGEDLRQIDAAVLRRQIGVVFQDFVRYHVTARENIWFGDIARPVEDGGIEQSAQNSGLAETVAELKDGYETVLGGWMPGGEELSGGEWQKVALARALLREARIVILDEPTSGLDPQAEAALFQKFQTLLQGRTGILISHRLSTVRMADRIYVLEEGRIAEQGAHEDLMRKRGIYASLFEIQAQSYQLASPPTFSIPELTGNSRSAREALYVPTG